jgi:hypothetical protein
MQTAVDMISPMLTGPGALAFPQENGVFAVRFQGEPRPRSCHTGRETMNQRRFKGIADTSGKAFPHGSRGGSGGDTAV